MKTITGIKAIFSRHKETKLDYFDSFGDAEDFLLDEEDNGNLIPIAIIGDNGNFWVYESFVMTENEAIAFAKNEMIKLGYSPSHMMGTFK